MLVAPAVAFADLVLAIHILSAIIGFGIVFAYPVLLASASRLDPNILPWLFRTRKRVGRVVVNPGLTVLVLAGIYLASDEHQWSYFYVQWGIAAVIVIGAIEGSFMIPRHGRLAEIAERDLAGTAVTAGGQRTSATWSEEYSRLFRQLWLGGVVMALIVLVTEFIMTTHAGS